MTAAEAAPEIHQTEPISGFTTIQGITINPMVIVLFLVLAAGAYLLWRGQRDNGRNTFDVYDLLMDTLPDKTRRASGIKTTYQASFILSSWVVVDREIKGTLDSGIFGLYLTVWCASLIAKVIFDKQDPPKLGAEPKPEAV